MSRPRSKVKCVARRGIATDSFACTDCKRAPLHAATVQCACSFDRRGRLLCRDCAWLDDIIQHGSSRVAAPDGVDVESVRWLLNRWGMVAVNGPWHRTLPGRTVYSA